MLKRNGPQMGSVSGGREKGWWDTRSDLPDPRQRGTKPPQGLQPKGVAVALTRALGLGTGKILNVYTDSYMHTGQSGRKEVGLLRRINRGNMAESIVKLLEALRLPKKVVVTHCRGHQKGGATGGHNCQRAALEPVTWQLPLTPRRPGPSNHPQSTQRKN